MSRGRHFADWKLRVRGVDYQVKVVAYDLSFSATWDNGDGETILCQNSDIKKLQNMMIDRLKARIDFKWEDKIHIILQSNINDITGNFGHSVQPNTAKITVQLLRVQIATQPDGQKIHRVGGPGQAYKYGWPDVGANIQDGWEKIDMQSMVDDTPQNRAALQQLFVQLRNLNKGLCKMMSPRNVKKTLAAVATGRMLPAPKSS